MALMVLTASAAAAPSGGALAVAEAALDRGQWRRAEAAYREVLAERPFAARATLGLGRSLASLGRCDEALELLGSARFAAGWDERAWLAEARCLWALGRPHDALEALEFAAARAPESAAVWLAASRIRLAVGDLAGTEQAVDRLIGCEGGVEQEPLVRAELAMRSGAVPDGWLVEADRAQPTAPLTGILDGRRWLDLGDPATAERALREHPAPAAVRGGLATWRGEALRRLGRTAEAHALLAPSPDAGPRDPAGDALLARVWVDLGRPDLAVELLNGAPDPAGPEVLASRWYVARALGDEDAARWARSWSAGNHVVDRTLDQLVPWAPPDAGAPLPEVAW